MNRPIKLAFLIFSEYPIGGAPRRVVATIKKLNESLKSKYEFHLITDKKTLLLYRESGILDQIPDRLIHSFTSLSNRFSKQFSYFQLNLILKSYRLEGIHIISPNSFYFSILKKLRVKKVLNIVNYSPLISQKNYWSLVEFIMGINVDAVFCWYSELSNKLRNDLKRTKVVTASTCFTRLENEVENVLWDNKENIIIWAASLFEIKDPLFFLRGIENISNSIRNLRWKIFVLGDGPLRNEVLNFIDNHDIHDIVTYLNGEENIEKYFIRSKIFVSTQIIENFTSNSMMEAMQCGNYIISKDVGDTKKMFPLIKYYDGLFKASSEDEMSKKIVQFMELDLEEQFNKMKEVHSNIEKKLNFRNYCNELFEIWDKVFQR